MSYLIVGLLLFLGVHSIRIVADNWRAELCKQFGEQTFKGLYSVLSLVGLVLIIWGFGMARETPTLLWLPPNAMRHVAALLNVLAFVLLVAAYVPGNAIKARVHHPMVLGTLLWALAHLISNGNLAHGVLFGSFFGWALLDLLSLRRRDRVQGVQYPAGTALATAFTLALGVAMAAVFALLLHGMLIGVKPFG